MRFLLFIFLVTVIFSCGLFKKKSAKENEQPVARVYDHYLYPSDLTGIGKGSARPSDSAEAVRNYIDSWIRHALLLHYAEENLPENNDAIEKQLQDYRESLIIYTYEKELIAQKMDTVVSAAEIKKYYEENKSKFQLKTPIVKLKYVMLPALTKIKLDSARNWLKNTTVYNYPKLKDFVQSYAIRYSINDTAWFRMNDMEKMLVAGNIDYTSAVYNKSYLEENDPTYLYLVKFDDFKFQGNDAPIDYVRNEIINIIINKRKINFINNAHQTIFEDAQNGKKFEIY